MRKISTLIIPLFVLFATNTYARPQYAAKQGLISCTACHFNPTGAGPRTIFGKAFGSRGLGVGEHTNTDYYGADLRALFYKPIKNTRNSATGIGLMNVDLNGSAPVLLGADGSEMRAVGSYDMGQYDSSKTRDLFIRWQLAHSNYFTPEHIVFGKFLPPFGLFTDEHRTYTKIQTKSVLRSDGYDIGFMASGLLHHSIHYDLALTDGSPYHARPAGAAGPTTNTTVATTLNLRHKPIRTLPFYFGLSGKYVDINSPAQPTPLRKNPTAYGAYAVYGGKRVSLQTEFVVAQHMVKNNALITLYFVNNSTTPGYYNEIYSKKSFGNFTQFTYEINDHVTFVYKYDFLTLDKAYVSDAFQRHSPGFNFFINSNFDITTRYERALVGRDGIRETGTVATQDIWLVLAHFWL